MASTSGWLTTNSIDGGCYFWVSWSQASQSVTGNSTTINWSCGVNSTHYYYTNAIRMSAVYINGTCVYGGGTYSNIYKESRTLGSGSLTIYHESDGTKTFSVGGFDGWLYGSGTASCGGASYTLTTIPRVSDISVLNSTVVAGGTQTVTATKKSSSFTDAISVTLGNHSMSVTSGTSFTIPESWMTEFPDATSATCTATVTTSSGSTTIGSKSVTFTLSASDYTIPASRSLSPSSTPSAFGNRYVQLLSKVAATITASGYQGSSIESVITTIEGLQYSGTSITSEFLTTNGNVSVSTLVTDSRGKTRTITGTVSVIAYHAPTLDASVLAVPSSNRCEISLSGEISAVSNLNAKKYSITWTNNDSESGTLANKVTLSNYSYDLSVNHNNIDPSLTYTYTIKVIDSVGYTQTIVVTGKPVISRHAGGDGVTFGKEASQSGFRVAEGWDAIIESSNGDIDLRRLSVVPVGTIIPFGGSTVPSGWLECTGAAVSRTTYSQLFSVIGTAYGSGNGSTTFNIPNLKGRIPQGNGTLGNETYTLGQTKNAGVPNVLGEFHHNGTYSGTNMSSNLLSGAIVAKTASSQYYINGRTGGSGWSDWGIDASHSTATGASAVYGNSTTVQPNTVVVKYIIRATNDAITEPASQTIEQRIAAIEQQLGVDYIVEQRTDGIWFYRKWESGVIELFGLYSTNSGSASTSWGYLKYSNVSPISYPFTLTSISNLIISPESQSNDLWAIAGTDGTLSKTPTICTVSASSYSNLSLKLNIHVIGRWK